MDKRITTLKQLEGSKLYLIYSLIIKKLSKIFNIYRWKNY